MCSLTLPTIPPSDESGEELRKNVEALAQLRLTVDGVYFA